MPFSSGIQNSSGMPQIGGSAGEFVRPNAGLPYQMWLNALTGILYYDNGSSWNVLKADPINPFTFSTGLTNSDYVISANLSTGVTTGNQSVIGGNTGDPLAYLTLIANIGGGTGSYLSFYSTAIGTKYFQDTGNWNFGGTTDAGYLANFEGDVKFAADMYAQNIFGLGGAYMNDLAIQATNGTGILNMARQGSTPSQVANKTLFFADSTGRLSWFNGNASYLRTLDATGITAPRTWILPDATTTLAGLAVAQTFSAANTINNGTLTASAPALNLLQTWNNGSVVFNALLINVTNTASNSNSTLIDLQVGGASQLYVTRNGNLISGGTIQGTQFRPSNGTFLNSTVALTNGAAAQVGTITNAPAAGNPTKWIPINDNGTTRYIPCW